MIISKLAKDDVKEVYKIEKKTHGVNCFPLSNLKLFVNHKEYYVLKAKIKNEIVAYIIYDQVSCNIMNVTVKDGFRGQGIGTKLIYRIFEKFPNDIITLQVKTSNTKAIQLYERLCFDKVRTIKKLYQDGADCLIMQRRL